MSQHDYNIANQSFPSFRTDLNNALSAIQTTNSGTSLPTGAVAGQIWLDTTNATNPTLKFYDGADSISLATINYTANTVDWLDSSVTITGLSTTATGTVLTLSDTVSTSTVNLIIDNQKEIRFRETTANGTNYVGFKAPASLTADKIWVLPSADGTSGQFLKTDGAGNLSFSSDLPTTSFTGATTETSIAGGDLVLIYDDSATAVRKMTRTNFVAGVGKNNTPYFQARKTTTQSFSQNVYSAVLFDSEDFDANNAYDTATGKFQPSESGYYYIFGQIAFATSGGNEQINIYKNGTTVLQWSQFDSGSTTAHKAQQVQNIVNLNGTTDYVQIQGLTSNAGGANLSTSLLGTGDACVFLAYKLIGA